MFSPAGAAKMVNPCTESILNQMTNLAMDIALDYVLPASPMSDVCKSDLLEFEREVVAAVNGGVAADLLIDSLVANTAGIAGGCCGRPPADFCKKNSYMGAAGCDSCDACLAKHYSLGTAANNASNTSRRNGMMTTATAAVPAPPPPPSPPPPLLPSQPTETTMDISWCQFDGCEFDTADNSYLDICDWIFYADQYALTDENREKVQKAFQMVPPGEVTGYVAAEQQQQQHHLKSMRNNSKNNKNNNNVATTVAAIKSEPDDDYLWTSDNDLQPIILKAEPDADILQITELDHSYLQTGTNTCSSATTTTANSSTFVSPVKHHPNHHLDMLGLVTPPPSRSQSSGECRNNTLSSRFRRFIF